MSAVEKRVYWLVRCVDDAAELNNNSFISHHKLMIITIDAAIIIPTRFKIIYCSSEYDISIIIFEMSNYITELALKLLAFKLL